MFCEKCGCQLNDDAVFCRKCGARTSHGIETQSYPQIQMPQGQMNAQPAKKPVNKKLRNRIAMIVSILAFAVVIALPIIVLNNSPSRENPYNNSGNSSNIGLSLGNMPSELPELTSVNKVFINDALLERAKFVYTYNAAYGHYFAVAFNDNGDTVKFMAVLPERLCVSGAKYSGNDVSDNDIIFDVVVNNCEYNSKDNPEVFDNLSVSITDIEPFQSAFFKLSGAVDVNGRTIDIVAVGESDFKFPDTLNSSESTSSSSEPSSSSSSSSSKPSSSSSSSSSKPSSSSSSSSSKPQQTIPETVKETFTSSKTGNTFNVPNKKSANILLNNTKKMTVPAENAKHTGKYDNSFYVYVDGLTSGSDCFLKFDLQSQNGWGKGTTYSLSDMKEQYVNAIMQQGFYTSKGYNYSFSWEKYGNVFKDAQFKIIDYTKSTGEMKWYFYVKMSGGGTDCVVEGVAHTVLGENSNSSSGGSSSGGSSGGTVKPGGHQCGVCRGKGLVKCTNCDNGFQQCPSCHGAKTYYSYAQKRDVACPRCNGGGSIKCTRSDCVGGYKKCMSCDGHGYT